jgi:hypothetical protein
MTLATGQTQEAKYVESWPNSTSAWAGWSRFDSPVDRYGGVQYIPCYSAPAAHWSLLPVTRPASRKILSEKNISRGQGQHSMYLASWGWTLPILYRRRYYKIS